MELYVIVFLPIIISFAICALLCPFCIPFLRKLKFGQNVRDDGPESHLKKAGTPTMGGVMIMLAVIVASLVMIFVFDNYEIIPVVVLMVGFGLVGFLDDFIKIVKKRSLGLKAWQKLILQFVFTAIFVLTIGPVSLISKGNSLLDITKITIPFTSYEFQMPMWLFLIFVVFVVLGTVNGTNFTDGLDGLASSVTSVVAGFFLLAAMLINKNYASISGIMLGALLAFLLFNAHPAKVFMGDTGSLALGGYVAGIALMLKMPIIIIIVGLIYFVEVLSVMLQVSYFKLTHGKRIFKMAPIHHHFELCGYSETQVVTAFTIVTFILCMLGLVSMMGLL